jgi:hypothetical protein
VLFALACSASTTIWSVRPQVFSIMLLPLVAILVARDRLWVIPPTIALWANLHAGVAMGLVVVLASVVTAAIKDRDRLLPRALCFAASLAATLATPLGFRSWSELVASIARSSANRIQEWQPTALPPAHLAFWGVAAFLFWQVARRWRRLETPKDRILAVAALLALPFAVRNLRNVPAFMMLAAPAVTRLTHKPAGEPLGGSAPASAISLGAKGWWMLLAASLVAVSVVWRAWSAPWSMLGWTPISAPAAAAVRGCRPPLYNTYPDGGPLIWFVPEQRVFIDSRQDQYPIALIQAASRVEATGDYRALFARWAFNCAALPPTSPTVAALRRDGWRERFQDGSWVVLERP